MRAFIFTILFTLISQVSLAQTCAGGVPCDEAPPNLTLLIQAEPEGRLGNSFAWSIIGEQQPFFKTVLSAEDMVQVAVPPGSYQIRLLRASDQKVASAKVQIAGDGAVEKRLTLPPLAVDARRMRLVTATLDGAAPHPRGWSWQFIQGDQVMGSMTTPEPTVEFPLEVGTYTLRVRKGREKQETRAELIVEDGQGFLAVALPWDPVRFGSDAVAARIVPRDGAATPGTNPDGDAAQPAQPVLMAIYDAGTGQISVRLTQGAEALQGGTFWLTDAEGPGGLGVQFIEDTLEAKFDAAGLSAETLLVEARDATGLAIRARTKVEGWK